MVMISELLRFDVYDKQGKRGKIDDLSLSLLEDDYPPITGLILLSENDCRQIPWQEIREVDVTRRRIDVSDLRSGTPVERAAADGVLLRRDILDALIIDLQNRRTTRASDLQLAFEDGAFRLVAVDTGFSAMLRRISRGAFRHISPKALFDWKYVEFLRGDPAAVDSGAGYRLRIGRLPAGEIAKLTDFIPYLHAAELLKLLPDDKASNVLQAMSTERQLQVIDELGEAEVAALLTRMSPDLAADLVGRLDPALMKRYLSIIPKATSNHIVQLLRYPEDSVGGVMINNMVHLMADHTAADARAKMADFLERTDFASLIFVVEDEGDHRLVGTVSLRELLAADGEVRLAEIMDPYVATLDPFGPAREAAHRIIDGQLLAMPVVENGGRLIGAMTVNAAIAQLLPHTSELRTLRVFS